MTDNWDQITAFLAGARFDEVLVPAYVTGAAPAQVHLFAFAVFLRAGDRYLRLAEFDQGDQLQVAVVDRLEHDASLVEDPDVTLLTVDLTPQVLGEVDSFRITEACGYLTERSDPSAGRVAGLALTAVPGGVLLFDPLNTLGVRVLAQPDVDSWLAERSRIFPPAGVVRWNSPASLAE